MENASIHDIIDEAKLVQSHYIADRKDCIYCTRSFKYVYYFYVFMHENDLIKIK